ncbi:hypothetical protein ALC62_00877 [Cyphomyrmex costatus]|uniref:Uncharacterized protein n=1 Tax=Cyphomyrmex costatus TaxID=456900 RepID=A0A195D583_9HYME|nr:hypothetical protein ALC62_00877 [Cyphomyrmex costatus]
MGSARVREKGDNGRKWESETERGVFRGPAALAGWHLTICQNSPRPPPPPHPRHRATLRRVTELRASADDGRVPHPLLPLRPSYRTDSATRPPPPPRVAEIRECGRTLPVTTDRRRKRPRAAPAGLRAHSARFPISTRAKRLLY